MFHLVTPSGREKYDRQQRYNPLRFEEREISACGEEGEAHINASYSIPLFCKGSTLYQLTVFRDYTSNLVKVNHNAPRFWLLRTLRTYPACKTASRVCAQKPIQHQEFHSCKNASRQHYGRLRR